MLCSWLRFNIEPVVADFLSTVDLPEKSGGGARVGFFPGSTIGNLERAEITGFMQRAREDLGAGAQFVLGADLKKDPNILIPAYDDSAGITSEFNLNLLRRINGELDANFDVASFNHEARWNNDDARIEMHLVSERDQSVEISGKHSISDRVKPFILKTLESSRLMLLKNSSGSVAGKWQIAGWTKTVSFRCCYSRPFRI